MIEQEIVAQNCFLYTVTVFKHKFIEQCHFQFIYEFTYQIQIAKCCLSKKLKGHTSLGWVLSVYWRNVVPRLLTPPSTPVYPSKEMESQRTVMGQIGISNSCPTALKSRVRILF